MNGKRNRELFLAMLLCNDAQIEKSRVGDPTELALLDFGARYGLKKTHWELLLNGKKRMPLILTGK